MNTIVTLCAMAGFILLAALVFFVAALLNPNDKALDLDRLAKAIAAVENWDGHSIGAAGERGVYQLGIEVWCQHSHQPFAVAASRTPVALAEQDRVAMSHLTWIVACLPGLRLNRTAYDIALVYTAGYGNVVCRRITPEKRDYAARVANVYYSSR